MSNKNKVKKEESKEEVKVNDGIVPEVSKEVEIEPSALMVQVSELKSKLEELKDHKVREVAVAAEDSLKHAHKILGLAKFIDMALNPKKYEKKNK